MGPHSPGPQPRAPLDDRGCSEPGTVSDTATLIPLTGQSHPQLQPSFPLSSPVLLLLPLLTSSQCLQNKTKQNKKTEKKKKPKNHKTHFLEVNNSETSEKQKLKPAQYQTDTQNMQLADAWLLPVAPLAPCAHGARCCEAQSHHRWEERGLPRHRRRALPCFGRAHRSPAPATALRPTGWEP